MTEESNESKQLNVSIVGEGRDELDRRYFKFSVERSDVNIQPFAADEIIRDADPLYQALTNAGANIFTPRAKASLLNQLQNWESQPSSFKVATQVGWNGYAFVLPDEIIGTPDQPLETVFGNLDRKMLAKYHCKGSLQEWQENIGELCVGNSRLMFAASLAFTGPILRFVSGPRSGGFQFADKGETGKTTGAMVSGSIWGCHRSRGRKEKGFAESWNTTTGQVEVTALAHNETLFILDETKLAGNTDKKRGEMVIGTTFALADGTERERMNNKGPTRAGYFYFLSTSNYTLRELAQQARLDVDEAILGRLIDIHCPSGWHGIYDDLHGYKDGAKLTDVLKSRCRRYFGTPSREFIRRVQADYVKDRVELKRFLRARRNRYLKRCEARAKELGLRKLNRKWGRFATAYAAGSLAIRYNIIPWKRENLLQALLSCQFDGLRPAIADSLVADNSVEGLHNKLITYLRDHNGKFTNLDKAKLNSKSHKFGSVPGYQATFKDTKWLYLTADKLDAVIGVDRNADALKKQLADEGLLNRSSEGRFVVERPIFAAAIGKKKYARVHAIKASICKDQSR